MLGMSRNGVLQDRAKRRKYGLPPELRPAKLEDEGARALQHACGTTATGSTADITRIDVRRPDGDRAGLPGSPIPPRTAGARFRYRERRADPATSSRCSRRATQVRAATAGTTWNWRSTTTRRTPTTCERMHAAMKASLDYFTENFSPFQFRQVRILEFPALRALRAVVRQHHPVLGGHRLHRRTTATREKIDMVTYVTAHEVGAPVVGRTRSSARDQQGATLLVESLAQYSALMVMEQMYGPEQIRKFLKYELDRYLRCARRRGARGAAAGCGSRTSPTSTTRRAAWRCTCSRTRSARTRSTRRCAACWTSSRSSRRRIRTRPTWYAASARSRVRSISSSSPTCSRGSRCTTSR